ncbi:MAG: tRNA pseudouridine(55) synthase TruB [Candidatus Paceibacterota bacterium]
MKNEDDILLVDKPSGMTSFDVIRALRTKLSTKKMGHAPKSLRMGHAPKSLRMGHAPKSLRMGHAGTLDPLATGLLIIGVGEGTKKMSEFLKLPKEYEAEIMLGVQTDTGDTDGKVIQETPVAEIQKETIQDALLSLVGDIDLPVPLYSAVKQKGKPLYWRVRRGEEVIPPVKTMHVENVELMGVSYEEGRIRIQARMNVGSGTYIRSLAEELGRILGFPATISALRRTRIGEYSIHDAQSLEEVSV